MDFGAFPPEFNSARIYTGPGSGPLLAAASAFDQTASVTRSTFAGYQQVINSLVSEGWMGPASTAMAAAATPYTTWLSGTAGLLEQAATQAKAAAAAFEAAYAMTVPPAVVAANRTLHTALVAGNVLGQNTAAIAAAQAQYFEMWAQDALAMYTYAANSAAATVVAPFTPPSLVANPAGEANQQAATANAAAQPAASTTNTLQSLLSQIFPSSTGSTQAQPVLPFGLQSGDISNAITNLSSSSFSPMGLAGITQVGADAAVIHSVANGGVVGPFGGVIPGWGDLPAGISPSILAPGSGISAVTPGGGIGGLVSATSGRAGLVGSLSVPQSWSGATVPSSTSAALVSSWTAAPAAEASGAPGMPGMPMAGNGGGRGYGFAAPRYGFKPTVMVRPVVAG